MFEITLIGFLSHFRALTKTNSGFSTHFILTVYFHSSKSQLLTIFHLFFPSIISKFLLVFNLIQKKKPSLIKRLNFLKSSYHLSAKIQYQLQKIDFILFICSLKISILIVLSSLSFFTLSLFKNKGIHFILTQCQVNQFHKVHSLQSLTIFNHSIFLAEFLFVSTVSKQKQFSSLFTFQMNLIILFSTFSHKLDHISFHKCLE
jgi:hypothetical protein